MKKMYEAGGAWCFGVFGVVLGECE